MNAALLNWVTLGLREIPVFVFGIESFGIESFGIESFGIESFGIESFGIESFKADCHAVLFGVDCSPLGIASVKSSLAWVWSEQFV